VPAEKDSRTHARQKQRAATHVPEVPERAKRELGIGTTLGLLAAEAMSSVRLFGLGERVGFAWYLAWLLPAALDIYAITMVRFFAQLPGTHPLRHKASREAIRALVITVGCNALYETILEFSRQLPAWAPGALFVLVSALAPFVAGRLIHFRSEVGNNAAAADTSAQHPPAAVPQAQLPAAKTPAAPAAATIHAALPQQMPQKPDAAADASRPTPAATPTAAPQPPQTDRPAATTSVTTLVPKERRTDIAIDLIARHGRDGVSGKTLGDTIGTSRDTGIRVLRDVDAMPDLGERVAKARARLREAGETIADDIDEPDRESVLA
jgi:hypothetical protein